MATKPNILAICSDQHSPHVLGCYGNPIVDTPNLDRLAREGTLFSSAYCNDPICVPSRMSFMTGRYPFRIEVMGNGSILDSRVPTYAHMLVGAGYHTVLSGRMHFIGPDQRHGFLERLVGDVGPYAVRGSGTGRWTPLPPDLGHMEKPAPLLTVGAGNTVNLDFDRDVTNAACDWMRRYAEQSHATPFHMTVGLINPHCPYIARPELFDKYIDKIPVNDLSDAEAARQHPFHRQYRERIGVADIPPGKLRQATAAYYGLVEYVDQCVGQLVTTLEDTGLLDNTIVVYFADHGEMLGEHGRWHKGSFHEASSGVPLIVRVPEPMCVPPNVIPQVVSLVDLFPTLCDWAETDIPFPVDGDSLRPLLEGNAAGWKNVAKAEYYSYGSANRMVRQDDWKLCIYGGHDEPELFDLSSDPDELRNRAADPACTDVREQLQTLIADDGWDTDILRRADRLLKNVGYYTVLERWREQMERNPLVPEIPDYWQPQGNDGNWLRD